MHVAIKLNMVILGCVWLITCLGKSTNADIGINWGRNSVTTLIPSMVVDLLLQNGIRDVKLYNGDTNTIKAFSGTGIGVTVTIQALKSITSVGAARDWIMKTLKPFPEVNFRYVSIGSNAFIMARYTNGTFINLVNTLKYVQQALDELGYNGTVKAIMSNSAIGLITPNNTIPSKAEFLPEVKEALSQTLSFFEVTNAPFMIDIFPIASTYAMQLDIQFAFPDNKSTLVITDYENGLRYTNLFDLLYDSIVWALDKIGYGDKKIVVGQIGWPTDGCLWADVGAAERFWKAMLPKVSSNKGTPMRPGSPIDIYIHSLTDETFNPSWSPYNRHWGIYRSNGEPKYKIDVTGQGRDIYPSTAKGGNLMPERWCVFNNDFSNPEEVKRQFELACMVGDCTPLSPGGSCSMLLYKENISFAFNAYFQSKYQDEKACQFTGLGEVILENPSRDGCVFSVGVVHGNQPTVIVGTRKTEFSYKS